MKKLVVALLMTLAPATAMAESRFIDTKYWGLNIRLGIAVMNNVTEEKCNRADWDKFLGKARQMASTMKPTKATMEKMRKDGLDPTKPGAFLSFEFGVACFKDGALGIKFPLNGKAKHVYLHRAGRGWYRTP
ncbi:hypothetical protein [Taklimakanibacter albus]|uniref:Uncharacterized protein n=1 Tax=Taklimakanibacter albus TaxID=2800327 RepID=A0ACC5R1C1_9HYPH|nr:hypothetical protein [Aestuariivirga sp. YIM B02566]MBK1866392.1 hypothetical protein [Aestuariivirga sp. YIM B02566]